MLPLQSLRRPNSLLRDSALVLSSVGLIAISAQFTFPTEPVPFTLQTMAVMLCGLGLGVRRAVAAQIAYLGAGAIGLPVFANHLGGVACLFGPTGGYLISFLFVAALLGSCADRGWDKKILSCGAAIVLGIVTNLGLGSIWLSHFVPGQSAIQLGVFPFVGIELAKGAFVTLLVPGIRKLTA